LRRLDIGNLFPLQFLVAVQLTLGELADFIEGVERRMPLLLLESQKIFLKHRIIQVKSNTYTDIIICPAKFDRLHQPL
jgi:hypothetical protein